VTPLEFTRRLQWTAQDGTQGTDRFMAVCDANIAFKAAKTEKFARQLCVQSIAVYKQWSGFFSFLKKVSRLPACTERPHAHDMTGLEGTWLKHTVQTPGITGQFGAILSNVCFGFAAATSVVARAGAFAVLCCNITFF